MENRAAWERGNRARKTQAQTKFRVGQAVVYEQGHIKELLGQRGVVIRLEENRGGVWVRFGPADVGRRVVLSPFSLAIAGPNGALRRVARPGKATA